MKRGPKTKLFSLYTISSNLKLWSAKTEVKLPISASIQTAKSIPFWTTTAASAKKIILSALCSLLRVSPSFSPTELLNRKIFWWRSIASKKSLFGSYTRVGGRWQTNTTSEISKINMSWLSKKFTKKGMPRVSSAKMQRNFFREWWNLVSSRLTINPRNFWTNTKDRWIK